ncbi:peptidoglycan DD-metalloendopeptidase family protein [Catellatospora sp. KI3]|uniref:peptidoglycan DD-metalloendopeptidase family protein n=1 Tax=Catellatospora sp. KI3 TaxID=3041620 RepID=UPI0024829E40|nr:peptidoglycan DD-metalloendopeptidase family protein [Catellatospora sp. KI3]MDI1460748.1 peptidoglycan DD-metalloendopeptidase family protein [Catellatospora sp. KI3]
MLRRSLRAALVTALAGAAVLFAASPAAAAPVYKLPFPCGQVWNGNTRTDHNPLEAIDLTRAGGDGSPVYASAPGTVDLVKDNGTAGYGKHVRILHLTGHQTLYAHLKQYVVAQGAVVGYGTLIGYVGSTGDSTGPHLHYEQRLNGAIVKAKFDGVQASYYGNASYTSTNACQGANTGAGWIDTSSGAAQPMYSGPGSTFSLQGTIADGAYITIYCQITGQSVTGKYGTSTVWNRIGPSRFVPDTNSLTGYPGFIPSVPRC